MELLGLEWVGNTTRQLTTPKDSPRLVAKETVWCPSTYSSLQILIFYIHQIFNILYFRQFNLSSSPKCPKIAQKFTQNCQTGVNAGGSLKAGHRAN